MFSSVNSVGEDLEEVGGQIVVVICNLAPRADRGEGGKTENMFFLASTGEGDFSTTLVVGLVAPRKTRSGSTSLDFLGICSLGWGIYQTSPEKRGE